MTQAVDNVALLPGYLAAGTAVLVLLADLFVARRVVTLAVAAGGALATAVVAIVVGAGGDRSTFCLPDGCSYLLTNRSALVAAVFGFLTLGVLGLSAPLLRAGVAPTGEYCFLLACSMTGGVVLAAAGDLITLIVALETLTLPLYVLVGLRRQTMESAAAAVTFFVVSVVATAVSLLGAAILYAVTGRLHLAALLPALTGDVSLAGGAPVRALDLPLTSVGIALLVLGLAFKVAAVPFHAWAPATYDGAPLPVAAYLSTASKLGGVVAILAVVTVALPPAVTGPLLAALAVLTMTVGNLVALRQIRMTRLLAWSSVAQAGYILAPLGALALASGRTPAASSTAVTAAVAYTVFFVVLELAAFAAVVALREPTADGGRLDSYRGAARRHRWIGAALALALIGLAGLPPGLAGLFAKVAVVRSLLTGSSGWLAVVVALNAVIGLAYYVRVAALLYAPDPLNRPSRPVAWPVAGVLLIATAFAVAIGFAPQLVLDWSAR
ncbi:proton-conducting transporter membrane subunit [Asanoa sp. WMMD1127]|uniref:NADH-quinone oxidoreductase subunit N n=1 Tax=Asanoa sp. WMMD1127 TaxID=3016107 RepID=UPI002417696C|nr:proton-conducting transporter membrane subunit [Asanoa sp. WMMD1127]MDG4821244.1 proton-conducting transporter membrane subunit [Asanoa sp. WMMD1127]